MTISRQDANLRIFYPEIGAGGYSQVGGSVEFYLRINALLRSDMTVLDFGAGRGAQLQRDDAAFLTGLVKIQGKVRHLVGVDVDPVVRQNPFLDEVHVIGVGKPLPFPDDMFDLIFADWVLEHVATPEIFANEVRRVLKPGGWFCARTPNRWGVTGVGTNLIPNQFHARVLKVLQPNRQEQDVFPTTYKLNTRRRLRRYFRPVDWENFSYLHNPEPPYVQRSKLLIGAMLLLFRLTPARFATNFHVFLQKREDPVLFISRSENN